MFGSCEINQNLFIDKLKNYGNVIVTTESKNILITKVNEIKVDFINYTYPLIADTIIIDKIRMVSIEDIAAMKLNAIAGRGSKKDFIDLYYLLEIFTLKEIINFYLQKYSDGSAFLVIKSLTYFEDADNEIIPKMLNKDFNWDKCKLKIKKEVLKLS